MAHLKYKSLVTKEIIDYYLSKIKDDDDEKQKKDLINTVSKFDIRISTEPIIRGDEFFYKIWILKKVTKKENSYKRILFLESLQEKKFQ